MKQRGGKAVDEDAFLIRRMKNGDDEAIGIFVRKYYPLILRYCRVHIRDFGYAEDMTQETFARFFRTLTQYQHYGKAANYLYVIAGNCCRDFYKKHSEISLEDLPELADTGMEDQLSVRFALSSLPEEFREVAVLFFVQGLRQREIAKILGIGLPLVKYRVKRAKEMLAAFLGKEEL